MSYSIKKFIVFFLFALILSPFSEVSAQIPSDLSKMKSSQITDAQLMQFVQQAQSSGMSEADIIAEFQKKGLPEQDLQALAARVKGLTSTNNKEAIATEVPSAKRQYKPEINAPSPKANSSKVFGSELFSSADPLFVPNLKIATPKTYVIGPDDELQLDIYGNNISSQKLVVSPEGMVSVKYAGQVNLSGLSIAQATGILKARLLKFYPSLGNGSTQIQITLGSMRSIQIMVIGAVKKPGTITLPSIATLFNALYASGGPADNGSFRNIELVRDNKILSVADLYDFILKGDQSSNLSLRDNDVIRVPFAKIQVNLEGALNRTGIFEVKSTESLQQAIDFAGGFLSNAFKGRITGSRYTDTERRVIDIEKQGFSHFALENGDLLSVNTVIEKFENRVFITGAVSKPSAYALDKGLDIKSLIEKAQGLAEGAFTARASLVRVKEDQSKEFVDIDLRKHLSGEQSIALQKEDLLQVYFVQELKDIPTVTIGGAVRKGGDFIYEDSLTLQGLILKAGGLSENALVTNIEIGRRRSNINLASKGAFTTEIIQVDVKKDLSYFGADILLKPFDIVNIKVDPSKVKQITIKITGEVLYVGGYTLVSPEEKLSSVLMRAGGLLPYADVDGAKLIRKRELKETAQIKRLALSTVKLANLKDNNKDTSNLIANDELQSNTTEVALDLKSILANPGTDVDPTLIDGDELVVPKFVNTVSVGGEVLKPITVQFEVGRDLSYYLSAAGGFTKNAYKTRAFVVYPNGRSAKTHQFLGIRNYPKITPGSSIFIPLQPEQKGLDAAKAGILVSAFSATMTALVLFFR